MILSVRSVNGCTTAFQAESLGSLPSGRILNIPTGLASESPRLLTGGPDSSGQGALPWVGAILYRLLSKCGHCVRLKPERIQFDPESNHL